jgi:hypothetical protein
MTALTLFVLLSVAQYFVAQETQHSANQAPTPSPGPSADKVTKEPASPAEYRPGIGTIIVAELTNSVYAKKAKIGDRVECTVVQDLLYQGKIVVPRNAKVVGHVTEVEVSTKENQQSRLGLSFDRILLKDKKELLFQNPAIVVALAPPIRRSVRTATDVRDMPLEMQKGGQSSPGGPSSGSSTGASVLGAITSNPDLLGANMPSNGAALSGANRGVIGWPGLYLLKGAPGTSIIASPKGNVQLGFESQMVLRVMESGP